MKTGSKKTPLAMLPGVGVIHGAEACDYGNREHEPYDWRYGEVSMMAHLSAILRHIHAIIDGEDVARDSKVTHLGHIIAGSSIILDAKECGTLVDDRPDANGKAADLLEQLKKEKQR